MLVLRHKLWFLGMCRVRSWASIMPVGPFQLRIFTFWFFVVHMFDMYVTVLIDQPDRKCVC